MYHKSRIFHVKNISCNRFRVKQFSGTTPYCISINNAHNFCAFNFRIAHDIQKYFNNENFAIYMYSMYNVRVCFFIDQLSVQSEL